MCTQCIVLYLCVTVYANSVLGTYVLYCMYVLCMFVYSMFHMCIVCVCVSVCVLVYQCMYVCGAYIPVFVCVCIHAHISCIHVRIFDAPLPSTAASLHAFVPCAPHPSCSQYLFLPNYSHSIGSCPYRYQLGIVWPHCLWIWRWQ